MRSWTSARQQNKSFVCAHQIHWLLLFGMGRDVRQGAHATCENPPNATTMVSPPWFRLRSGISSSQKRLESVRESSCEGLYRCVAFFRGWQPRTHLFVRSPQRYGPSVSQLKQWRFLLGRSEPTAARSLTAVFRNDRKQSELHHECSGYFLITVQWVGYTPHRLFD